MAEALREADYRWLLPLVGVVLLSHLLRAWRWQILLEALPPDEGGSSRRVSIRTAFASLMIGYMVNYAAPRVGELARTAHLSNRERLRFSGVFGTVVVERVLDVIVLVLALGSVGILLLDRLHIVRELLVDPVVAGLIRIPMPAVAALALLAITIIGGGYLLMRSRDSLLRSSWHRRLKPLVASFRDGLYTVLRSPRRGALVLSTLAMWFLYLLMAHLPFLMLDMAGTYSLSLLDSWAIMTVGALGVAIPSPGGTGSYHYITIQTLVFLFAVDQEAAATYAVLSHGMQMLLYILVGVLCLMLQGTRLDALRPSTLAARGQEATPRSG